MDAVEVYVLCGSRSKSLAEKFLNSFASRRRQVASGYPYPEYVDEPEIIYDSVDPLISRLECDQASSYSVYWDCLMADGSEQVMLFFTRDGCMIAGIGGPKVSLEIALSNLSMLVNGKFGYVTSGSCPPDNLDEFISLCRSSTLPNIFEGKMRNCNPVCTQPDTIAKCKSSTKLGENG